MNLLDIVVTYLAIGSAFAMRGYFLNRRRPFWAKVSVIITQFFLWLPIWLVRFIDGNMLPRRAGSTPFGRIPEVESQIEDLISAIPGIRTRTEVREALDRYAALHMALHHEVGRASGEFELFAISGNGNGATGTPCLYRKNLNKLRAHKVRTADSLIRVFRQNSALSSLNSELSSLFETFGDLDSIAKLELSNCGSNIDDSIRVRLAA